VPFTVVIALGSNLAPRSWYLRAAIEGLAPHVRVVRVSRVHETEPVDAPPGSPRYLNMAVAGYTSLSPESLLRELLAIESRLGRRRGAVRNAPRTIDLDLILHSANRRHTRALTLPHPRYREREFVLAPMREVVMFRAERPLQRAASSSDVE
jgi:2-amino-4-hydroxy-6-hydroxymethyldihydropteridine diphosphokinase